jgi:hypothetical protein
MVFVQQLAAEGHCLSGVLPSMIDIVVEEAHSSDTLMSVYQTA